jgi:hypothetical protein
VGIADPQGRILEEFSIPHSQEGFAEFFTRVERYPPEDRGQVFTFEFRVVGFTPLGTAPQCAAHTPFAEGQFRYNSPPEDRGLPSDFVRGQLRRIVVVWV